MLQRSISLYWNDKSCSKALSLEQTLIFQTELKRPHRNIPVIDDTSWSRKRKKNVRRSWEGGRQGRLHEPQWRLVGVLLSKHKLEKQISVTLWRKSIGHWYQISRPDLIVQRCKHDLAAVAPCCWRGGYGYINAVCTFSKRSFRSLTYIFFHRTSVAGESKKWALLTLHLASHCG